MMRHLLLILTGLLLSTAVFAQSGQIAGTVTDSKEPVFGASVQVLREGNLLKGASTDIDGNYNIGGLEAGTYTVKISAIGYQTKVFTNQQLSNGQVLSLDAVLSDDTQTLETVIIDGNSGRKPIKQGDTKQGLVLTSEQITKRGTRDLGSIGAASAKVSQADEGQAVNAGGSRSNANDTYIDGVRVRGNIGISPDEVEQLEVITGGVPAQYGDATGVITSIVTKTPPAKFGGNITAETSQFLDAYETTRVDWGLNGPILTKVLKDSEGKPLMDKRTVTLADGTKKEESKEMRQSILGFRLSGIVFTSKDSRPSALGSYQLKDETLTYLEQNPLLSNGSTGLIPTASTILPSDLVETKVRPNNRTLSVSVAPTVLFRINDNTTLRFNGQYNYDQSRQAFDNYRLFNYKRNPIQLSNDYRGRLEFRQTIPTGEKSTMQNVNYSLQLDYTRNDRFIQDNIHKDNFFNYGYVGSFERTLRPSFRLSEERGADSLFHIEHYANQDVYTNYTPGGVNPEMDAYASAVERYLNPSDYNGLLVRNGNFSDDYGNIYGLYRNTGTVYNNYQKSQNNQLGVRAQTNFDIVSKKNPKNRHSIQVGLVFEQRIDRNYSLAPAGLWRLAENLANRHLNTSSVDTTNILYDTTVVGNIGVNGGIGSETVHVYAPGASSDPQSTFSRNLHALLGVANNVWINPQVLSPSQLSLSMFSATDLIEGRSAVLDYYGYDYLGNPLGTNVSFDDFFKKKDASGDYTRPVAPLAPIYVAGYIQDRFQYKSILFTAGVRVDRYDANTKVLRDPYTLYGAYTVNEIGNSPYTTAANQIPANVPGDAMVYVTDPNSPSSAAVVAFRSGDDWFSADGQSVNNPNSIDIAQYGIQNLIPARKDLTDEQSINLGDAASSVYDPNTSFRDYKPTLIVMPRLAFSFPISEASEFFAHYDILSQRPASNTSATAIDYFNFLGKVANSDVFDNANLKPARTTDYEIGYQQAVGDYAGLKFSVYYREFRDLIQVKRFLRAYPSEYESYANTDFGTTKGFTAEYNTIRHNNLQIIANYTLQFAEGTGSDAGSNRNLGLLRQPFYLNYDQRHTFYLNLDYRWAEGKEYNGPMLFGKPILENFGGNLEFNLNSGSPYTRRTVPARLDNNASTSAGNIVEGSRNGARNPWNFRVDLRIDKDIKLTKGDAKKPRYMNIYLRVQNLLNTQNVLSVYSTTGEALNDGYLTNQLGSGPATLASLGEQATSFTTLYNLRMRNPGNISLPRRIFIGASFQF